jgi:hypothetical protein
MMNTVVVLLRLTYSATSAPVCQAPLFSGPDAGSIGLWGRSAVVRQRGIVCQRDQGLSRGFPTSFWREKIIHGPEDSCITPHTQEYHIVMVMEIN